MSDPAIEMSHVTKNYGHTCALSDFSLSVNPGHIVGLLGENGAGKTTAMRVLLGYLASTEGTSSILGGDARDPSIRMRIGYLPGDFRIGSRGKVAGILQSVNQLRGGHFEKRIHDLADVLQLDMSKRFSSLSKGNRQKVGVVQALMHDPDVLVLDEPTAGLDPVAQKTVLSLVDERRDAGAAVLFSSHILSEVEDIADSVTILRRGKQVAHGTMSALSHSALQHLDFVLATAPPEDILTELPHVRVTSVEGPKLSVSIRGSAEEVFRTLTPFGIVRVDSGRHDLDYVFYEYYQGESE